ncbi:MAG: DUF262 domain-containing protein [Bryobacteraceae bacterium]
MNNGTAGNGKNMKMRADRRAVDKVFRRRDRYEIPDWQREKVWDIEKKRRLIDSMLRGWKLPKFYFVKTSEDEFEVVDGQQRLSAIFEFCANDLELDTASAKLFHGTKYKDLPARIADDFDDFEIEYDVLEEATEEDLKEFFQRLQGGMPLTSSEKLNSVHSKLRDFCRSVSKHAFFAEDIGVANTRYAHFDIASKVATIEIEGLDTGLRFDDIKGVFESNRSFSPNSATAKRIRVALDFLHRAFEGASGSLKTRSIVQSIVSLACRLVATGRVTGLEAEVRNFLAAFVAELSQQVQMGQAATDSDYLVFQRSVNANVKGAARIRHETLLRKLFRRSPELADIFDPSVIAESGVAGRLGALGESISDLVVQVNKGHAADTGEDLFKATNNTTQALLRIRKPIKNLAEYGKFIDYLYFIFRESVGSRLGDAWPTSFVDINVLRTDLRHDVDHGASSKIRAKRKKASNTFTKYSGSATPDTIEPSRLPLAQANILGAIEDDLRAILSKHASNEDPV